jgi:hypothetical protein
MKRQTLKPEVPKPCPICSVAMQAKGEIGQPHARWKAWAKLRFTSDQIDADDRAVTLRRCLGLRSLTAYVASGYGLNLSLKGVSAKCRNSDHAYDNQNKAADKHRQQAATRIWILCRRSD